MTEISVSEGISRRTVLKAGAWTIPVVAAAAAAPAATASEVGQFTIYNQTWMYNEVSTEYQYIRLVVQDAGSTAPSGFVNISTPTASGPYNADPSRTDQFFDGSGTSWLLWFPLTQRPADDGQVLTGVVTLVGLGSVALTAVYPDI
ncbi:hypothetical protein ACF044_11905 [Microbacterium sp. NPDC016588]